MDAEIERIATAMKIAALWDNTLFVFAADNGGPPCEPQERPLRALSSLFPAAGGAGGPFFLIMSYRYQQSPSVSHSTATRKAQSGRTGSKPILCLGWGSQHQATQL